MTWDRPIFLDDCEVIHRVWRDRRSSSKRLDRNAGEEARGLFDKGFGILRLCYRRVIRATPATDEDMGDIATVQQIMKEFADRTGLTTGTVKPVRYLWTDAFGVCNYLPPARTSAGYGSKRSCGAAAFSSMDILSNGRTA